LKIWIKYGVMFICLVLAQIVILNHVQLGGYINPYIYVLFILLLPVSLPQYAVVLLAFLIGFIVDVFSDSPGMHASASVFMAFIRPYVFDFFSAREMDKNDYPGLKQYGFRWFLYYSGSLIFAHHLFYFSVEVFTFHGFYLTLFRTFLSTFFSLFIVVLSQYIFFRD